MDSVIFYSVSRAARLTALPGNAGPIMVMGLDGKVWAHKGPVTANAALATMLIKRFFMMRRSLKGERGQV